MHTRTRALRVDLAHQQLLYLAPQEVLDVYADAVSSRESPTLTAVLGAPSWMANRFVVPEVPVEEGGRALDLADGGEQAEELAAYQSELQQLGAELEPAELHLDELAGGT